MKRYSVNRVVLAGIVGQPPSIITRPDGVKMAFFQLGTSPREDRIPLPAEQMDWHYISIVGRFAQFAQEYIRKGSWINLEGKIVQGVHDSIEVSNIVWLEDAPPEWKISLP